MKNNNISSVPKERYEQQLEDKRWLFKSENIRIRDKHQCRLCGAQHTQLDVHHIRYIYGREAWDYDDGDLVTLCHKCHEEIHDGQDFDKLIPGGYFFNKDLEGVGIVESKQSNSIWFHACWAEGKHYQEDNHGRLYNESEAYRGAVRVAKPNEIRDFWEKVEKYYSIDHIIFDFGAHLRNLLPADHPIRIKAREKFKEAIVLYNKQRDIVKKRFEYFLLVSDENFVELKNQRISSYANWTETTLPCAYFHVASKKDVKEHPQEDNSENVPFEDFDFTGYRAATLDEVSEWCEYIYHLDCLHKNDLPF